MTTATTTTTEPVRHPRFRSTSSTSGPAVAPARSARGGVGRPPAHPSPGALASQTASPADEQLAMLAADGSQKSFIELVDRFQNRLFNFLLRRVRCAADAEDLAQETFIRAWQQIHRYRPSNRFSTWLFTIASRLAVDLHRARKRQPVRRSTDDVAQLQAAPNSVAAGHESSLWKLAAELLTDEQHAALWLRYAEDLSSAEVARVLGRTRIGVRVMLHRARATLANHLNTSASHGDSR